MNIKRNQQSCQLKSQLIRYHLRLEEHILLHRCNRPGHLHIPKNHQNAHCAVWQVDRLQGPHQTHRAYFVDKPLYDEDLNCKYNFFVSFGYFN